MFVLISFSYTADILDHLTATPVITGKLVDASETVVAAIIQSPGNKPCTRRIAFLRLLNTFLGGTKNLEFYIPPTLGSGYSLAFGNIWLQWVYGGMFVGLRRIIWSIQVISNSYFQCFVSKHVSG